MFELVDSIHQSAVIKVIGVGGGGGTARGVGGATVSLQNAQWEEMEDDEMIYHLLHPKAHLFRSGGLHEMVGRLALRS